MFIRYIISCISHDRSNKISQSFFLWTCWIVVYVQVLVGWCEWQKIFHPILGSKNNCIQMIQKTLPNSPKKIIEFLYDIQIAHKKCQVKQPIWRVSLKNSRVPNWGSVTSVILFRNKKIPLLSTLSWIAFLEVHATTKDPVGSCLTTEYRQGSAETLCAFVERIELHFVRDLGAEWDR